MANLNWNRLVVPAAIIVLAVIAALSGYLLISTQK
jgi:hypothetical protein